MRGKYQPGDIKRDFVSVKATGEGSEILRKIGAAMNIFTLDQIKRVLPELDLVPDIEEGFRQYSGGQAVAPPVGELLPNILPPPGWRELALPAREFRRACSCNICAM